MPRLPGYTFTPNREQLEALGKGRELAHYTLRRYQQMAVRLFADSYEAMEELGGGSVKGFLVKVGEKNPVALMLMATRLGERYAPSPERLEASIEGEVVYRNAAELREAMQRRGLPPPPSLKDIDSETLEREQLIAKASVAEARAKEAEQTKDRVLQATLVKMPTPQ